MDFQQPHRYMRPPPVPPPSVADPRQSVPPQVSWFSGQFQYHHSSQHSPSSPPHHQQWPPHPPSDHFPPPPPPPYQGPAHHPFPGHPLHDQYVPSHRPPVPHIHPPPPHSQISQSFTQDWGNMNWGHRQGWEYPGHKIEEDWAAKARAWAAAKVATDNLYPPPQYTTVGRPEEQNHYHNQYQQNVDTCFPNVQPSVPASSYQQYPAPAAPPHRSTTAHPQESVANGTGQSFNVPDRHLPCNARDGMLTGDSNAAFSRQEISSASPLVHQQEVSSSYSSITGKEEAADQNEKLYKSLSLPIASSQEQHHVQQQLPAIDRSVSMEHIHYAYGNRSAERTADLSGQPLDFAHRFNRENDPHLQANYNHTDIGGPIRGAESVEAVPSLHTWTPIAAGVVYPPAPPVFPLGPQHDPSIPVPSPVSGHSAPVFGRMPGPSFQPTIPPVGASFGVGAGNVLHTTATFHGDAYGVSGVSERPKKASVPNWLREEIIKKTAVIGSSALEHPKVETQSLEDEGVENSIGKDDQADSKSIDSFRLTEEEEDDEEYVEAARTAAINQEIKRVLTEVLLKVTDELFNEIAIRVLSEESLTVEGGHEIVAANQKLLPPALATPKASAKVLIPAKARETDSEDVSGKSNSNTPGDVLGLASYASDVDENDEIQSSAVPNSEEDTVHQPQNGTKLSEDIYAYEIGISKTEAKHGKNHGNVEADPGSNGQNGDIIHHGAAVSEFSPNMAGREPVHGNFQPSYSSKKVSGYMEDETDVIGEKRLDGSKASKSRDSTREMNVAKTELLIESVIEKKLKTDDSLARESRCGLDKSDKDEAKRTSVGKDLVKAVETGKSRAEEKGVENRVKQDRRLARKEVADDRHGLKEGIKEQGVKTMEISKEYDLKKKSSHPNVKEDRRKTERDRKATTKEDVDRKRERAKSEKGEKIRYKYANESSRHKKRRSSSVSSKDKNSKDNSVVNYAIDSSDESSDDSKRRLHSKRRNPTPSPTRSRRRQVSRSPHSRHSQRRRSPCSFETTRERRSRSKSPVRWQR